jgi:tetratricopeptide (TPR) repeat protein
LNNLGILYSEVGRRRDAVEPTERAVAIRETLAADNPAFLNDLAMSLNNLGACYSDVGTADEGARRWTAVLERFTADSTAGVVLRVGRVRGDNEHDEAVDDVLQAHEIDRGTEPEITAQLRAKARALRSRNPGRFDARWSQVAGQTPAWLLLDDDTLQEAADWINARTWSESRALLMSHANRLLTDSGETAVTELALISGDDPMVTNHEQILQAAREHGIDEVYRPLLILDTVHAWLGIDDFDDSKRFLIEHHDDLTTPEAAETLAQQDAHVHHAFATLAREGQTDRAYELLHTPDELPAALADARRTATPQQLHAIAQLAHATARTGDEQALAAIHVAIVLVLTGNDEDAKTLSGQLDAAELDTTPLIHALTDAITSHPDHAPALAALIHQLTTG